MFLSENEFAPCTRDALNKLLINIPIAKPRAMKATRSRDLEQRPEEEHVFQHWSEITLECSCLLCSRVLTSNTVHMILRSFLLLAFSELSRNVLTKGQRLAKVLEERIQKTSVRDLVISCLQRIRIDFLIL